MNKDIGFCSITEDLCKKNEKCKDCSLKHIHENIEHYAKLHEENKLIELPCKVGDTVYSIHSAGLIHAVIAETYADAFFLMLSVAEGRFGKTVFLTKEEAEARLKELEGAE